VELRIEGAHHLAFIADRIAETHRFWTELFGLRFSWAVTNLHVPSTGLYSPHMHVFYELGRNGNVAYFAIDRTTLDPGPNWSDLEPRYCALQAPSFDEVARWRDHLAVNGVAVEEERDPDGHLVLAFRDPEGLRWKLTGPVAAHTPERAERAAATLAQWVARRSPTHA
jgi:catechol 2,3-dioxygenase-like lactoylglutathione lyase family enzyme